MMSLAIQPVKRLEIMKITNMNQHLAKSSVYFPVYKNGKHIGNYTTEKSAQEAFNNAD